MQYYVLPCATFARAPSMLLRELLRKYPCKYSLRSESCHTFDIAKVCVGCQCNYFSRLIIHTLKNISQIAHLSCTSAHPYLWFDTLFLNMKMFSDWTIDRIRYVKSEIHDQSCNFMDEKISRTSIFRFPTEMLILFRTRPRRIIKNHLDNVCNLSLL